MSNHNEGVQDFLNKLVHPLSEEIMSVRNIILDSDWDITEHIKWNAPRFRYKGEDRVTFNLHKDRIQLVFHRGANVRDGETFAFEDGTGLLKWVADDRALVTVKDMEDVRAKNTALAKVVAQWMQSTS